MQFEAELSKLSSRAEREPALSEVEGDLGSARLQQEPAFLFARDQWANEASPGSTLSLKAVASSPLRRYRFGNFHKRPRRMR